MLRDWQEKEENVIEKTYVYKQTGKRTRICLRLSAISGATAFFADLNGEYDVTDLDERRYLLFTRE